MKKDNWIYKVFLMTFFLSLIFSFVSNAITSNANIIVMIIITFIVIGIGTTILVMVSTGWVVQLIMNAKERKTKKKEEENA